LTPEQAGAFQPIEAALNAGRQASYLLHGVTGSGKTEVYLRALERTIALGRRAIVLVPEIALTPQTVRRFAERFPGQVAVLHSGLSQGELFDQWHGIAEGRYAVVIGSRSAVFAPQPDLGLIVIDEEHEWTYKQQDPAPRYHAREAAVELAKLCKAVLVLGSATPDVTSYQKALWGQHDLIELRQRVRPVWSNTVIPANGTLSSRASTPHPGRSATRPLPSRGEGTVSAIPPRREMASDSRVVSSTEMPPVEVVDMREELKGGNRSIFSRPLQLALFQTVERGEQAILFLNRRGSAGFLQCRDCGFVPQCSACAIAMGFHRQGGPAGEGRMLCHQCNRSRAVYNRCPMCGSPRLRPMGLGVEAVEESAAELLPGLRTLRWDRDVTQGRNAHEEILSSFLKHEADVLIGTQMVAKGLDLPSVTLVGVISADIGLHIPDFRSAERTFQLLTQVAGRAGRTASEDGGPQAGQVVIQTYTPDNYAIIAAAQHDYHAFFEHEIELRQAEAYPPFVRLARLIYSHSNAERAEREAVRLAKELQQTSAVRGLPGVEVIGPAPPHIPKWRGRTRWQVTVRSPDPVELLQDVKLTEGWTLDIDPASLA
jgi:primosomal protein N' (replication factor Y)